MKNLFKFAVLLVCILLGPVLQYGMRAEHFNGEVIRGDYLGQKVPGNSPKPFAHKVLGSKVSCISFTPDGKELYFAEDTPDIPDINVIKYMKMGANGVWSSPKIVPFSGKYRDWNINLSPAGDRLYFTSCRPLMGEGPAIMDNNIWYVERRGKEWSVPFSPGKLINTPSMDCYASVTGQGTIYFHRFGDPGTLGGADIYKSALVGGTFCEPVNIGAPVNTKFHELDVLVGPKEKWIIFLSYNRPEGLGMGDLYISYRLPAGKWTKPKHMGNEINSSGGEICPSLSPDGRYLFFTSFRASPGVYWVSTEIIKNLKEHK